MTDIATHIRDYLAHSGMSKRALSLEAKLHSKSVSEILSGAVKRPSAAALAALSAIIGVDLIAIPVARETVADDVYGWLKGNRLAHWSEPQRRGALTALNLFVRNTAPGGRTMARFDRDGVRKLLSTRSAAALGVSPSTLSSYASHLCALCDVAESHQRPATIRDVTGPWRVLYEMVSDAIDAGELTNDTAFVAGGFCAWAHAVGLRIDMIDGSNFAAYCEHRIAHGGVTTSVAKHRSVVARCLALWNKLACAPRFERFAMRVATSPFPDGRDKYAMPLELLESLLREVDGLIIPWARGVATPGGIPVEAALDALLPIEKAPVSLKKAKLSGYVGKQARIDKKSRQERLKAAGILPSGATWSEETAKRARAGFISLAKALWSSKQVLIESVDELTDPEMLEYAATALDEACDDDNQGSSYIEGVLKKVRKVARDFARRNPTEIEQIDDLIADFKPDFAGIAPRNRAKLQQFTPDRIYRFTRMSVEIMDEVNANLARKKRAAARRGVTLTDRELFDDTIVRLLEVAIAHDIMLARAPRSGNLLAIDLAAHVRNAPDGGVVIELPPELVKNKTAINIPLGEAESRFFNLYTDRVRPLLIGEANAGNTRLFPARLSAEGHYTCLTKALVTEVHERVGVRIHPHLYRHIVGWIWLKEDPNALPKVQVLLGHKSLETTMKFYAELDTELCLQEWADLIERTQNEPPNGAAQGCNRSGRHAGRRLAA